MKVREPDLQTARIHERRRDPCSRFRIPKVGTSQPTGGVRDSASGTNLFRFPQSKSLAGTSKVLWVPVVTESRLAQGKSNGCQ